MVMFHLGWCTFHLFRPPSQRPKQIMDSMRGSRNFWKGGGGLQPLMTTFVFYSVRKVGEGGCSPKNGKKCPFFGKFFDDFPATLPLNPPMDSALIVLVHVPLFLYRIKNGLISFVYFHFVCFRPLKNIYLFIIIIFFGGGGGGGVLVWSPNK